MINDIKYNDLKSQLELTEVVNKYAFSLACEIIKECNKRKCEIDINKIINFAEDIKIALIQNDPVKWNIVFILY